MAEFHDYYELLNINRLSDSETIRAAIKDIRKRYRRIESSPDQKQRANAEQMMSLLAEAEGVLLDSEKRSQYDSQYLANKEAQTKQQQTERNESGTEKRDWTSEAQSYYDNGQYNNALFAASEATRQNPSDEQAWYLRTWSAYNINRFGEAEFAASEMIKLNPDIASMHAILGDIYTEQNRYEAALAEYKIGARLDQNSPYYPMRIAAIILPDDTEAGIAMARSAYERFPEDQGIRNLLALAYLTSAQEGMSHVDDRYYFTNERQIAHARDMIQKIDGLGAIEDDDLRAAKSEINKLIIDAESIEFLSPGKWYLILSGFYLVAIFGGALTSPTTYPLLILHVVIGYFLYCPKKFKVTARALGPAARNTGLQ